MNLLFIFLFVLQAIVALFFASMWINQNNVNKLQVGVNKHLLEMIKILHEEVKELTKELTKNAK